MVLASVALPRLACAALDFAGGPLGGDLGVELLCDEGEVPLTQRLEEAKGVHGWNRSGVPGGQEKSKQRPLAMTDHAEPARFDPRLSSQEAERRRGFLLVGCNPDGVGVRGIGA